jgi:hypothetical protein
LVPKAGEEKLAMYNHYGPLAIKSNSLKMTYKVQDVIIVCVCVCASEGAKAQQERQHSHCTYFSLLVAEVSEMGHINDIERCK